MEYTQEDIKQLKSKAEIGEHSAQIELGKYYLENNFSNSNLSNGENYLRLAANKHNEEATYLLIALYLKYIKYFIENAKGSTRIRTYIRECDK
jgi:TPR repeat protein